ncbi:YqjF family protein [Tundrisphaera lichenicola]|uniref:YqjF family protein n=1 Tax=Tundrisphaera lichenicola TaxID=2029860 RepID=UPI003EB7B17E
MIPTNPEILDDDREALTRRPAGRPVMYQSWDRLLFLHWEVPAEAIRRLLPSGLEVDLFEGRAFVGLVPFTMRGIRPAGLPSVRGLSNFHETNVRTYVHRDGRDPGVWFFSLDAANLAGACLGRSWFGLPYFFARMSLVAEESPDSLRISYSSRRLFLGPRPATTRIEAEVRSPVVPAVLGSLEYFLAERYLLYSASRGGGLFTGRVHHSPYPLQVAEVRSMEESVLAAAGIERPDAPPLAHFARGVDVEVFGLERVGHDRVVIGEAPPDRRDPG